MIASKQFYKSNPNVEKPAKRVKKVKINNDSLESLKGRFSKE